MVGARHQANAGGQCDEEGTFFTSPIGVLGDVVDMLGESWMWCLCLLAKLDVLCMDAEKKCMLYH